jgi:hypothetical protein
MRITSYNVDGSQYKGNDKFASTVLPTLKTIGDVQIGNSLLSSLTSSQHNFTFTNTASSGGDRSLSFESNIGRFKQAGMPDAIHSKKP